MADESLSVAGQLPAALSAFLRGAERRAFVFLWLQGGDAAAAERALAAAIRAFPGPAAAMPMAEWPLRFWKLLAALPVQAGAGSWPPGSEALATMPASARQALLLRQVAGLDEVEAATVMGVEPAAYQALLAQACPRTPDGAPDAAGWRRQAEAIQQAGRGLDAAQGVRLAQLREVALAARPPQAAARQTPVAGPAAASPGTRDRRRRRTGGGWPGLLLVLLVLAVAVALTAWLSGRTPSVVGPAAAPAEVEDFKVHDNPAVQVEALPPVDPRAGVEPWPASLESQPAPDPLLAQLALLSWYAAGAPGSALEHEGTAEAGAVSMADLGGDAVDWAHLGPFEQASVRAAAAALAAEPAPVQADLRARFAALDAMERRGWRLGPTLGADYARLQPLVGFIEPEQRAPLLDALRALEPEQRAQLGELAQRTPPAERAALRRELLLQPPAQRGAWLSERARR